MRLGDPSCVDRKRSERKCSSWFSLTLQDPLLWQVLALVSDSPWPSCLFLASVIPPFLAVLSLLGLFSCALATQLCV